MILIDSIQSQNKDRLISLVLLFDYLGRITRLAVGNAIAFLSGLFFTVNNFIIKGARLSFGEVLAVRSIIQIPLMSLILFMRGI